MNPIPPPQCARVFAYPALNCRSGYTPRPGRHVDDAVMAGCDRPGTCHNAVIPGFGERQKMPDGALCRRRSASDRATNLPAKTLRNSRQLGATSSAKQTAKRLIHQDVVELAPMAGFHAQLRGWLLKMSCARYHRPLTYIDRNFHRLNSRATYLYACVPVQNRFQGALSRTITTVVKW